MLAIPITVATANGGRSWCQPPNLIGKISLMQKHELLLRAPHPEDGRAIGLHLTEGGVELILQAAKFRARARYCYPM